MYDFFVFVYWWTEMTLQVLNINEPKISPAYSGPYVVTPSEQSRTVSSGAYWSEKFLDMQLP